MQVWQTTEKEMHIVRSEPNLTLRQLVVESVHLGSSPTPKIDARI